jgi:hypothetical protein
LAFLTSGSYNSSGTSKISVCTIVIAFWFDGLPIYGNIRNQKFIANKNFWWIERFVARRKMGEVRLGQLDFEKFEKSSCPSRTSFVSTNLQTSCLCYVYISDRARA